MSGLLGRQPQQQLPATPEPTILPVVDDEVIRRAKKKAYAEQRQRGGRQSTILSTKDKLGS